MVKRITIKELLLENDVNKEYQHFTIVAFLEHFGLFFQMINNVLKRSDVDSFPNLKSFLQAKVFGTSTDYTYVELDRLFYANYSQRHISPFMDMFRYTVNGGTLLFDDYKFSLGEVLLTRFGNRWDRYIEELGIEYEPLYNYDMDEEENQRVDVSTSNSLTNKVSGFNSDELVTNSQDIGSTTTMGDFDKNHRKLTRKGNIGVTTSQQMLESEIKLRDFNIISKRLVEDVAQLLTSGVYYE